MKKKSTFADLLEESFKKRKNIEIGSVYDAKVSSIQDDYVFLKLVSEDISGIVSTEEFSILGDPKPKIGDLLKVFHLYEESGDYYFTTCLSSETINIDLLNHAKEKDFPVLGQISSEINGGYEVKVGGYTTFCPFSQLDQEFKSKKLVGQKIKFIISEINFKSNKIVLSQKKIADKEKELKKEILKEELEVGHFVNCTIQSIHHFGLIVEINGLNGLIPISETSFKKNIDLNKEFKIGQSLRAKVMSLDWKENKFTLTIKDFLDNPWAKNMPFKEGDVISATVDSIKNFGIFMKLDDHFNALVPNKELGIPHRAPIASYFKIGEMIDIFIIEINPEKKQIAASISKAKESKEKMEYQKYLKDQNSESNTSSFGLLLKKSLKK